MIDDDTSSDVRAHAEALKERGEHARAAEVLVRGGEFEDAARIYEQLFEYVPAIDAWERAGDLASALRVALKGGLADDVDRLVASATRSGQAQSLLKMLGQSGRYEEIGKIHLAAGDVEAAAAAFERGGNHLRAASCKEELGDVRSAGVLYERHLEENPNDPEACLRLGRILGQFSRHDDAIALLQRAVRGTTDKRLMLGRAAPLMILSFLQLGYSAAADEVLARWQADDPTGAPVGDLAQFLASERATALAASLIKSGPGHVAPEQPLGLHAFYAPTGQREDDPASALVDSPSEEATVLLGGRYLLGEPLGGGGVGQVFRAYDALFDQPVAVKIFGSQAMGSDSVKAFAREARAASALENVAVNPVVELNLAQGFVVTAFVEGEPLEDRLRRGGSCAWVLPFTRGLLALLETAHRVGLVHGALKPTNLFLVPGGLRVMDFGAHHLLALRSTETGGLASVWPYLAPEQLFGATPDVSADLYALAAILYRALVGRPPFTRDDADRRRAPAPPSSIRPDIPPEWDAFLVKGLAPRPEERFTSAREMLEALASLKLSLELPAAVSLSGEEKGAILEGEGDERYAKRDLVFRDGARARVFEGVDRTLDRPVWLVDVEDAERDLEPLRVCAGLGHGVQPVYDVLPSARRVVVARDPSRRRANLEQLRRVPQGLLRDLVAVARALEGLHAASLAFGGFDVARALGPVGPRIRLAPALLPVAASAEAVSADWGSFAALVDEVMAVDKNPDVAPRDRLLEALESRKLVERNQRVALNDLVDDAIPWSRFFDAVTEAVIQGAQKRVIAELAASVLRG